MNKIISSILGLLFVIALIASSCHSSRSMLKKPLKAKGSEYLLQQMERSELDFNTLSLKASVEIIQEGKKQSFKAKMRLQKDSLIWISISPLLGIEFIRLELTVDSVKLMNRIDKNYFCGDYSIVNRFLETSVDFNILQALILGNDFSYYERATFRADIDHNEYKLSTAKRHKLKKYIRNSEDEQRTFLHDIWLNANNFKITRIKLKEANRNPRKIEAIYSDYNYISGQLFPTNISFEINADKKTLLDLSYGSIKINEELAFPFKISSKYKALNIAY